MYRVIELLKEGLIVFILLELGNYVSGLMAPVFLIPGSIVGMGLLFALLMTGVIKIGQVDYLSGFMLKHMGFFFIPLGVGLMNSIGLLSTSWLPLLIILIFSGALVMFVSAKVTDLLINLMQKKEVDV